VKIAIPLFGSRVSPRFGCTSEILIVNMEPLHSSGDKGSVLYQQGYFDIDVFYVNERRKNFNENRSFSYGSRP
jgi:hypothetical protein